MSTLRFSAIYQLSPAQDQKLAAAQNAQSLTDAQHNPSTITRKVAEIINEPALRNDADWMNFPASRAFDLDTVRCPDGAFILTRKGVDDIAKFEQFRDRNAPHKSGYEIVQSYMEDNRDRIEYLA